MDPNGLGAAGRRLWDAVTAEYELQAHEEQLLGEAARTVDVVEALHERVSVEGLIVQGGRVNPALVELRQQRVLYGRLLAMLRVPLGEQEHDAGSALTPRLQRRTLRGVYQLRGDAG